MGATRSRRPLVLGGVLVVVLVVVAVVATVALRPRQSSDVTADRARQTVVQALPDPTTVVGLDPQDTPEGVVGERVSPAVLVQTGADIKAIVCSGTVGATPEQARSARVQARETFITAAASSTIPGSSDPGLQALSVSATAFSGSGITAAMNALAEQARDCPSTEADSTRTFVAVPPGGPDPGPPRQPGDTTPAPPETVAGLDLTVSNRIAWRALVPASLSPRGSTLHVTCLVDRVNLVVTRSCGAAGSSTRADELATLGAGRLLDGLS